MSGRTKKHCVLLVEDDPDDTLLVKEACRAAGLAVELRTAVDGQEAMEYLQRRGRYADPGHAPGPQLILLDLNLPRKSGFEVLAEVRSDPVLAAIPVVVLTTSKAAEDISHAYELGANSFVTKPASFEALVEVMKVIGWYWFHIAVPPTGLAGRNGI